MKNVKNEDRTIRKGWIFPLAFFLLTALNIVFSVLCLYNTRLPFFTQNRVLFIVLAVVCMCALCSLSVWFSIKGKETWTKTLFSVYVFLLFCFVLILILQKSGFFEIVNTPDKLREFLERTGIWMPVLYIVLQYLQVIVLPIPSIVSTVAGVALFGPFYTMIYSLIGIILGSVTAFFIGRKLGYKAVSWIVGEETLKKWKAKLKGKDNLLLTLMFLLPLFPDDVLCFLAGLSSMSTKYFLIMIAVARVLGVAGTCYSFNFIPFDTWWGLMIWGVLIGGMILAFIFVSKNMDKIQDSLKKWKTKRGKSKKKRYK